MIRQVFEDLKTDSRNGDFYYLVQQDMSDLDIEIPEEDIIKMKKTTLEEFNTYNSKRSLPKILIIRK